MLKMPQVCTITREQMLGATPTHLESLLLLKCTFRLANTCLAVKTSRMLECSSIPKKKRVQQKSSAAAGNSFVTPLQRFVGGSIAWGWKSTHTMHQSPEKNPIHSPKLSCWEKIWQLRAFSRSCTFRRMPLLFQTEKRIASPHHPCEQQRKAHYKDFPGFRGWVMKTTLEEYPPVSGEDTDVEPKGESKNLRNLATFRRRECCLF